MYLLPFIDEICLSEGYGVCTNLQTAGKYGCPTCGPNQLTARRSKALGKVLYIGFRKYLPPKHPWRGSYYDQRYGGAKAGIRLFKRVNQQFWLQQWKKVSKDKSVPLKQSGMTGRSIFNRLPYYKVSPLSSIISHFCNSGMV
jgi:hypothetical protein